MGIYPLSSLLKGMAKASKTVMARLANRNPDSPYPLRRNTPNHKGGKKESAKESYETKGQTARLRIHRTSITSPITTGISRSALVDSQTSISPMFIAVVHYKTLSAPSFISCACAVDLSNRD